MSKLKAFTLIELLVVMGIITMLFGLGAYGLTRFQANTRVQSSFNDVLSLLKTVQNNARNSVSFTNSSGFTPSICSSTGSCVPDYYGIKFSGNQYTVYGCLKSGNNINCPAQNDLGYKQLNLTGINITFTGQQCDYIVFQRLTADIIDVTGSPTWAPSANTVCNIRISNTEGDSRTIEVNLNTNVIRDATI